MADDGELRFRKAIMAARQLPPDLLMHSQKLKLYALFRQSQGPAPEAPADDAGELGQAKWEAWNDVRSLSKQQAMNSYSAIIEGLINMLEAEGGAPLKPPEAEPKPPARANPPLEDGAAARRPPQPLVGRGGGGGESAEVEPIVDTTTWSTDSLTLAPGSHVDVPLAVSEPCKCRYAFSVVEGTGPIGLRIEDAIHGAATGGEGGGRAPLLHLYESEARGSFDVPAPSGGTLLQATFDNSASLITSVGVKCHVSLEPLSQLAARDAFRAREALMASMVGMSANLEAQAAAYQRLVEEEDALLEHKKELLSKLSSVTARIEAKSAEIDTSLEAASAMKAQIDEMAARLHAMKGEAKGE